MTSTSPVQVDLGTEDMTEAFRVAPVYRKSAVVTIRAAGLGERIATTMTSGLEETVVTCAGGEPVITNPGGEQYVLIGGWAQVERRYRRLSGNQWQARGMIRAFANPTGQPVVTDAPWGERQQQDADCLFATEYLPDEPYKIGPDRYLIGADEFRQTYKLVPGQA
jgi:hypothetical protein